MPKSIDGIIHHRRYRFTLILYKKKTNPPPPPRTEQNRTAAYDMSNLVITPTFKFLRSL